MTQLTQNSDQIKNNYCVIDLETTGLDYRNDAIIELAVIKFDLEGISDTYQSFVKPGREIPPFISDLTGIFD
ncbi:MAG: 3'-5' exonuclease, partial [SAR202 cluster bacterium]|nr:3'-5' exonuclease [SAR202 cluster bacterium]